MSVAPLKFDTRPRLQDRDFRQLSGDTITLSGSTSIVGNFRIVPNATNGHVLTSDSNGYATWVSPSSLSASTNTYVTGGTVVGFTIVLGLNDGSEATPIDLSPLSGTSTPFRYNSIVTTAIEPRLGSNVSSGDYSSINGGSSNTLSSSTQSIIGGGDSNSMTNSNMSVIGGGTLNILLNSGYSFVGGGAGNYINGGNYCNIIGGAAHYMNNLSGDCTYSSIIGGKNNQLSSTVGSTIIGGENNVNVYDNTHIIGSNITASKDNTTYVENLHIKNTINTDVGDVTFGVVTGYTVTNESVVFVDNTISGGTVYLPPASASTGMMIWTIAKGDVVVPYEVGVSTVGGVDIIRFNEANNGTTVTLNATSTIVRSVLWVSDGVGWFAASSSIA